MLVSFRHKFVYIHVYKTAGSSVRAALEPYAYEPPGERLLARAGVKNVALPWDRLKALDTHSGALGVRRSLGVDTYEDLFSFGFVRNPWDWQVSLYHYMRQRPEHRQHDLVTGFSDFPEYLEWRIQEDLHLQKEYYTDEDGKIIVDFLGTFDRLDEDFASICDRVGIDATLPDLNESADRPYRSYYDDHTRELVAEHFAPDIETFGFEF